MYKLQTRMVTEESGEFWDNVINTRLSKTSTVVQVFFSEDEAEAFAKTHKLKEYRVVDNDTE
jgi:hypothetical protein